MKFDIVQHFRWVQLLPGRDIYILDKTDRTAKAKGGITIAALIDGDTIRWGISYCHKKDNFNKKIGREAAITRATENPIIVTENLPYDVAKAFTYMLSLTRLDRHPNLNLEKYVEILKENPDHNFENGDFNLRELYFKD